MEKTVIKTKSWKQPGGKDKLHREEQKDEDILLIRSYSSQKMLEKHLKYWKTKKSPIKNSLKSENIFPNLSQIKISDKQKGRGFITSKCSLQQILKKISRQIKNDNR